MEITRPTVMEISLKNFQYNIEQIRKLTSNAKLMPVVKANGYGTYINKNLEVIKNFDIVAVAIVDEAIELRKLGYTGEIFVLNQPSIQEISKIIDYDYFIYQIVGATCVKAKVFKSFYLISTTGKPHLRGYQILIGNNQK